ncbi:DUF4111 domain-containing protein, partial [Bacteroides fragilis]|nr:DUF4111 domain-containing protein [Bacteroides fragilis]
PAMDLKQPAGVLEAADAAYRERAWSLGAGRVQWRLLGPARMHATLTTGEVISKQEAGARALGLFPHHAPILA